jgi:CheY-like chemotaxis protein
MIVTMNVPRRPRIILAEDDAAPRELLAKVMRALGADVESSADGGRLLVAVASQYDTGHAPEDIDLIVTDIRMPVMSGLDVVEALRVAHWRTPIILMTAYATPAIHARATKLGATLLLKPLDLDVFEETVRELISPSGPGLMVAPDQSPPGIGPSRAIGHGPG